MTQVVLPLRRTDFQVAMADNPPIDITRSRDHDRDAAAEDPLYQRNHGQGLDDSTSVAEPDRKDPPDVPDGGYGWVCVACVFWINAHTWGINSVSTMFSCHCC
jgi:hypothetical protein